MLIHKVQDSGLLKKGRAIIGKFLVSFLQISRRSHKFFSEVDKRALVLPESISRLVQIGCCLPLWMPKYGTTRKFGQI